MSSSANHVLSDQEHKRTPGSGWTRHVCRTAGGHRHHGRTGHPAGYPAPTIIEWLTGIHLVGCAGVLTLLACGGAVAAEKRCGWYENPTNGNLLLSDKDGEWWITSQMQAQGADAGGADEHAPRLDNKEFVKTQPNGYGYGCACLTVETDPASHHITKVIDGRTMPLKTCRGDKSLPKPSTG